MAKHHLRKDNHCENCGRMVEERYCTHCGQENVETRQTFGHLVRHFLEDLTHYESNFWKTIKYLLFRPAYLTRTYLEGKRMMYVPPVKLYIFISFVAFFLPGVMPDLNDTYERDTLVLRQRAQLREQLDSLDNAGGQQTQVTGTVNGYSSEHQYDSAQVSLSVSKRDGPVKQFFTRKMLRLYTNLSKEEAKEHFKESFGHHFPKALFVYLPLFAFIVWLFHGKKRWYYFDHAIFTLHVFSFLLLLITLFGLIGRLIPWHYIVEPDIVSLILFVTGWIWSVYYYYRAHRKLYMETRGISFLKASLILLVNTLVFLLLFIAFIFMLLVAGH